MTPILIAPYMFALAGNATWLAYVFGGAMLTFVALCINQFARRSSAAGSMYGYVAQNLGPRLGAVGGWTLLWSYGFVATAVLGAMALFVSQLLARDAIHAPAIAIVAVLAVIAWQAAYRGVQISAIVMLVLEIVSVAIITLVVAIVLHAHGATLDRAQLTLRGGFPGGIGLAISFALFSFVGFESATAFGGEAKNPLVTIPRAVVGSVIFAALFFVIATYAEIVGFSDVRQSLAKETFPLGTLVNAYGIGELAIPLTVGALCSAFSVCLACITTAGRIAYAMALDNVLPAIFARIEPRHDTPNVAVTVVTAVTLGVAVAALSFGVAPIDIFNNCGSLSSCGFLLIYTLIAIAAFLYCRRLGQARVAETAITVAALLFLIVPAVTLFYPPPDPPQRWFPYIFLFFIAAGTVAFRFRKATG